MKIIIIVTLLFVTGCATVHKGWTPPWITTEEGLALCPTCKIEMNYVPVYYGYPSEELMKICSFGRGILGGCVIEGRMPTKGYLCPECGAKFLDEREKENILEVYRSNRLEKEKEPNSGWYIDKNYIIYDNLFIGGYDKLDDRVKEFEDIDKRDLKDRF